MVTAFSCHDYQARSIASRIPYRSRQTPQRHLVHAHAEARLDPVADVPRIVHPLLVTRLGPASASSSARSAPSVAPIRCRPKASPRREDGGRTSSSPRRRKPMFTRLFQSVATHPSRVVGATDPCFVSRAVRADARPSFSAIAGLDTVPAVPGRRRWLPPPRTHRTRCPPTRSPADGDVQAALLSVAAKARTIKLLQG